MKQIELGSVVYSVAGHDAGRFYVVVEIVDDKYVKIADGKLRKANAPKLKKIKHLAVQAEVAEEIGRKLSENQNVVDAEVRRALHAYNGSI